MRADAGYARIPPHCVEVYSMKTMIAVDPGGTKCSALLADPDGKVLKFNRLVGRNTTGRHLSSIAAACEPLLSAYDGSPLCVTSVGKMLTIPAARRMFKKEFEVLAAMKRLFGPEFEYIAVTEADAALAVAGEAHGIVALSGTGAFVHLVTEDGAVEHLDGRGPLTGDFGGGFWIGQSALRAMTRGLMHSRHATSLGRVIRAMMEPREFWKIALFNVKSGDRKTVAALAAVVNREAEAGDRVSREILLAAAHELSETVFDALDKHDLLKSDYPLFGTGGVVCGSDIFWNSFVENVRAFAPNLRFGRLMSHPAVAGVALAGARNLMDKASYELYRRNLLDSCPLGHSTQVVQEKSPAARPAGRSTGHLHPARSKRGRDGDDARRAFWTEQMDAAFGFMEKMLDYPVEDCGEPLVDLEQVVEESGVIVEFSHTRLAGRHQRIFRLREGLIADFVGVAGDMNKRGWVLKVEDAYRTTAMQKALALQEKVIDVVLKRVIWENGGAIPAPDLFFRRLSVLVATRPRTGTHMSGSAIDISVLRMDDRSELDRGGPYLELSELTPMSSPFISREASETRDEITALMRKRGFMAYPYEFWHYSKGDAFAEFLEKSGRSGRYGPIAFNAATGVVEAIEHPHDSLHDPADIEWRLEQALERADAAARR